MRHAACFILSAFVSACAPRSDQAADSVATEPDVLTAEDSAAAVPPGPAFRLIGNEPFWNLQIDSTGIVFRTIEDTVGNRFPATQPVMAGDTLRWNSVNEVSEVEAIVVPQECSDTMSDRKWPYRAIVIIDRRRLRGCAERR